MSVNINTKFGVGDKAYGFYNTCFYKFNIDEIRIKYTCEQDLLEYSTIEYECTAVLPDSDITFKETFSEDQLFSIDQIKNMLKQLDSLNEEQNIKEKEESE